MGKLFKLVFWGALLAFLLSPVILYFLVLDTSPMALPPPHLKQEDISRVQRLLYQQQSQANRDGIVTVTLGEREINTAISYGLQSIRVPAIQGMVVAMDERRATLRGSIELPLGTERRFLNYETALEPSGKTLNFVKLTAGYLSVPPALANWLETRALEQLGNHEQLENLRSAWSAIETIEVRNYQLSVSYRNNAAVRNSVAAQQDKLLLDRIDSAIVDRYLAHLEPISQQLASNRYPLLGLMAPAFELARQRSDAGENPIVENTAAIVSLAMYTADPRLLAFTRLDDRFGYPSRGLVLTLHRRKDLAQHFITSALISLFAGDQVAELIGVQKELNDTRTNSGFDLADLMADKAGIRYAELATASKKSARRLQADVVPLIYDDQLLPNPKSLPRVDVTAKLADLDERELEPFLNKLDRQVRQQLAGVALYRL